MHRRIRQSDQFGIRAGGFPARHDNESVFRIIIAQRQNVASMSGPRLLQDFGVGGVALHQVCFRRIRMAFNGRQYHDDIMATLQQGRVQTLRQGAGACQDNVIFTHGMSNPSVHQPPDIAPDQRPHHSTDRGGKHRDPQDNDGDGKHPRRIGLRTDVAISHGGHGNNGKIQRRHRIVNGRRKFVPQIQHAEHRIHQQAGHAEHGKQAAGRQAGPIKMTPADQ